LGHEKASRRLLAEEKPWRKSTPVMGETPLKSKSYAGGRRNCIRKKKPKDVGGEISKRGLGESTSFNLWRGVKKKAVLRQQHSEKGSWHK